MNHKISLILILLLVPIQLVFAEGEYYVADGQKIYYDNLVKVNRGIPFIVTGIIEGYEENTQVVIEYEAIGKDFKILTSGITAKHGSFEYIIMTDERFPTGLYRFNIHAPEGTYTNYFLVQDQMISSVFILTIQIIGISSWISFNLITTYLRYAERKRSCPFCMSEDFTVISEDKSIEPVYNCNGCGAFGYVSTIKL